MPGHQRGRPFSRFCCFVLCRQYAFTEFHRSGFVFSGKAPFAYSCLVVKTQFRFCGCQGHLPGPPHGKDCASLALAPCRQPRPAPDRAGV